jgi:transcriptional regulator with XRE-family HTH domain
MLAKLLTVWIGDRSQTVAAEELGIGQTTLSSWLTGKSLPPPARVKLLAKQIGEDPGQLKSWIDTERAVRVLGISVNTVPQTKAWIDQQSTPAGEGE